MTIYVTAVEARSGELKGVLLPILICGLALAIFGMISLFVLQT